MSTYTVVVTYIFIIGESQVEFGYNEQGQIKGVKIKEPGRIAAYVKTKNPIDGFLQNERRKSEQYQERKAGKGK